MMVTNLGIVVIYNYATDQLGAREEFLAVIAMQMRAVKEVTQPAAKWLSGEQIDDYLAILGEGNWP